MLSLDPYQNLTLLLESIMNLECLFDTGYNRTEQFMFCWAAWAVFYYSQEFKVTGIPLQPGLNGDGAGPSFLRMTPPILPSLLIPSPPY